MKIIPAIMVCTLLCAASGAVEKDSVNNFCRISAFKVKSGKLAVELDSRFFWNINGIRFNNFEVAHKNRGFYGTVIRFKECGWVGSGHLENGIGEKIINLSFVADGKKFIPELPEIECRNFRMQKHSILKNAELFYDFELADGVINESARVVFKEASEVLVMYHFMHCFNRNFSSYKAIDSSGKLHSGNMPLEKNGEMLDFSRPQKAIFFNHEAGIAVCSSVEKSSGAPEDFWRFWNRGMQDRKMYYVALKDLKVPKGFDYVWNMTTDFKKMSSGEWEQLR